MRQELIIQGVPDRIKRDAWWLETISTPQQDHHPSTTSDGPLLSSIRMQHAIPVLAALITVADWLFWKQPLGISVAVFALILSAAIMVTKRARPSRSEWIWVTGFTLLCNLPVAIDFQFLSVLFSLGGIICLALWVIYGGKSSEGAAVRLAVRLPTVGAVLLIRDALLDTQTVNINSGLRRHATSLLLPLIMGVVFLALLASANPVLEDVIAELDPGYLFEWEFWMRVLFWGLCACLIWPYLNLSDPWLGPRVRQPVAPKAGPARSSFLINPVSVRNSLLLFNLLFLVQTVMDLGILTGGVALPEGMSYASYAHRGAYPLVVTALLAGLFTLMTHTMIKTDTTLRVLVYLWLAQNVFLVVTAAFRLQLYVDAYALTHLRVAAFIWMALVMVGLVLTLLQIHRGQSRGWLLRRCFVATLVTLYACCFVNFAEIIARYNLRHGDLASRDGYYICSLGADAYPAIHAYELEADQDLCGRSMRYYLNQNRIDTWREWGFRRWRIQAYYQQHN
ncbi:DUF4173 domain-containing protein [Ruegeria sp. SCPT10]|uniref:DUF4153 domain-containing protein n=1 Tax=Ruegeria sp. SCP10 TaxID=3141377 RepID=UPI00333BC95D